MSNSQNEYFYVVDVLNLKDDLGRNLPPIKEHAMAFQATPKKAQGILFAQGYNLGSEEGIFDDNKLKFVSEMFETTDGSNSMENDVPDRLNVILKGHAYTRLFRSPRFETLHVQRYIVPKMGGTRKRRRTHKKRRMTQRRR
jgi:hypothetical protein